MKKALLLSLLLSSLNTQADVITFDDLPSFTNDDITADVPNGYHGFDWTAFGYVGKDALPDTGYQAGAVSGDFVGYFNTLGNGLISGNTFDFNGSYLTSAWHNNLQVEVKGFSAGNETFSKTVTLSNSVAQWFDFDFFGIDALSFHAFGGDVNPLMGDDFYSEQFVLDNFTFNETVSTTVAEPTTLALLGLGLFALGLRLRRVD